MVVALYACIMAFMFLVLSYRVIFLRYKRKIPVGDGGDKEMMTLIQARSNIVDYVPLALLMMLILEILGTKALFLHGFGLSIIVSRLLQGWGLSVSSGGSWGRISGAILMHIALATEALLCLWNYIIFNDSILAVLF